MNFSVCLIAKNESKTLPRLINSLKEFQERGGEILLLDTGSTDGTTQIARDLGCKVYEVGDKFVQSIDKKLASAINKQFIVKGESKIIEDGDKLFNYSAARNYIANLASNDMIAMPDCDEIYTKFNIDEVSKLIGLGVEQLEYNFVFSHDQYGNEAIKFMHSKFYNRTKLQWVGIIHEVLQGEAKRQFVDESIIKLEHFQNHETNRGGYLKGLALDCYLNPQNDRHAHYFGRELLWSGRPRSAIKELERHIEMMAWQPERGQSMIYIGDAYQNLGIDEMAVSCYQKSFTIESGRRESLMKLCEFYFKKNDHQKVACYAEAALQISQSNFYANNLEHYTFKPHEYLYWAHWYLGNKKKSKQYFEEAFKYRPLDHKFLHDVRFYRTLPKISIILPTLGREEGLKRCLDSIERLNYPKELIEMIVLHDEPRMGVPKRVAEGLKKSAGEVIVFASNDIEFDSDSLILAVLASEEKGLVAFNTGPVSQDEGNICEHFLIRRDIIEKIGGEIFDTEFNHVGVDNLLWSQCKKIDEAGRCEKAKITHFHFTKGAEFDEIYQIGWKEEMVKKDRELLERKLIELNS